MKPTTAEKLFAKKVFARYFREISNYDKVIMKQDEDHYLCQGSEKGCFVVEGFPWVIKFDLYVYEDSIMREAKNYQRAIAKGLESYFAPTYFIGKVNGVGLVLQRKLEVDSDTTASHIVDSEYFADDYDSSWESCSSYLDISVNDYKLVYCLFGSCELLEEFCLRYRINDLHCGNFGWDGENVWIIDFSGYYAA